MRVRALDVSSASIDGEEIAMGACTLAARTDPDGRRGWEASGWLHRPVPRLTGRTDGPTPHAVVLDTDGGRFSGSALVSVGSAARPNGGGFPVYLTGVGRLDPWPG